ncbi:MAG TPA: Hsp20/alpha crystallin family protein [Longimicrobiales bacterium]|nr:Hsp20/alpha crystallin family protein [Longimicrobiales bacterium]
MAIVRYPFRSPTLSPWREFDEVTNRLARLFDEFPMFPIRRGDGGMWSPPVSVSETSDELIFTAELPGLSEKDVNIELENDVLTISGEKSEERTEGDEERRYHLWERRYGSFRRSFTLPRAVDGAQARATFENGVLEIRLPKAAEARGRKIEISKAAN